MKIEVREGNYEKLGAVCGKDTVIFTFGGEKEDACAVVLVNRRTKEEIRVEVPEEYCIGSLRSITVGRFPVSDYVYCLEINGKRELDPYAKGIWGREIWNDRCREENEFAVYGTFEKGDFSRMDYKPEIPKGQMFMYKLHVRGFTMELSSSKTRGTFRALMNRIGYLKRLGVTTVELMPVYEFEEMTLLSGEELPVYIPKSGRENTDDSKETARKRDERVNFWGYGPGNYFAIKASYASNPQKAKKEFFQLVSKFHENGMELIMEMFFPEDTNQNLIMDALRYWVREGHVDGFHLLGKNIPVTAIAQDVLLSRTKIFCESFPKDLADKERRYPNLYVYTEEYLYPARKLLNHFNGNMKEFMNQQRKQGTTLGFVNYIASNNGFTLADLFMYNDRHNEANGENNQDGNAWNFSNNYGIEGPTRKRYVNELRHLKWRNAVLMLCLAQGVPLLGAGDEMGNSQMGNNNAYCQDNSLGWLNWKNEKSHRKDVEFLSKLIAFRREHPVLSNEKPFQFSDYKSIGCPDLSYHGENAWILEPNEERMCIGVLYCGDYSTDSTKSQDVYVCYNFFSAVSCLAIPNPGSNRNWYQVIDSSRADMPYFDEPLLVTDQTIQMSPQSICVFVSEKQKPGKEKIRRKKKDE